MPDRPRILQFGKTGQLGRELIQAAIERGFTLRALSRAEADFTDPAAIIRSVTETPDIDVVVNASAYTAVDKAESEAALATAINAEAVNALANACKKRGVPLIHISTDYVYDGEKPGPYLETDEANPLNVYGHTKLAGENAIRNAGVPHVILRTSWLYGVFGTNFVKTMLRLSGERSELRVVDDQQGAPTSARELALTVLDIANRLWNEPTQDRLGTFHFSGAGETSWFGFAQAIISRAGRATGRQAHILPIPTAEYPTAAMRPRNSRLDCRKIERAFGVRTKPWEDSLQDVLSKLLAGG